MGGDSCCTKSTPCMPGEGDCDRDDDCVGGLRCDRDGCQIDFFFSMPDFSTKIAFFSKAFE